MLGRAKLAPLVENSPQGQIKGKKGLSKGLFCFSQRVYDDQDRMSKNPLRIGCRLIMRITATTPGPFFISEEAGMIMISIVFLMITFSVLLQCGHRIENLPSELKTASLKMMLVQ